MPKPTIITNEELLEGLEKGTTSILTQLSIILRNIFKGIK